MIIYCDRCRNEVHALSSYCFYCGSIAPAKTIVGEFKEVGFKNGIYCSSCGINNPEDAAFCGRCSESLFKKPEGTAVFCPTCGEKNAASAAGCSVCRALFADWYSMRGAATKLGFNDALTVKEKMTGITYHFINADGKNEIAIGRAPANDIVIPCSFVSSSHCRIDVKNKKLTDLGSGNCTYINRSPEPVHEVGLLDVNEFNVAGSFTFNTVKSNAVFIFRLMAILDEDECNKNGDPAGYELLRKQYYIVFSGNQEVLIRKQDGYIDAEKNHQHDYFSVKIENGYYYYSDDGRDIADRLMFRKAFNWPVNWERL